MTVIRWTSEDDATILRMRDEGVLYRDIARLLKRNEKSVSNRLRVLRKGAPGRKMVLTRPEVKAFATAAAVDGIAPTVIALAIKTKFGLVVHPDTVRTFTRKIPRAPVATAYVAPLPVPKTEIQFAEWVIRKKEWPVQRLDQNGVPAGFVKIALSGGMVPA